MPTNKYSAHHKAHPSIHHDAHHSVHPSTDDSLHSTTINAANAAADMIQAEIIARYGQIDSDVKALLDVMVNTTITLAKKPTATLTDVIMECYGGEDFTFEAAMSL